MNMTIDSTRDAEASSGVVLTLKGERYCRDQEHKDRVRAEAEEIIEGALDMVERLLRMLDQLDGDADFEIDTDDEFDPADDEATHQPVTLNRDGGAA